MGLNLYSSSTVIIIFHQNVGILLNFSKNGRNYKRKSENIFFCVPIELHTVQYSTCIYTVETLVEFAKTLNCTASTHCGPVFPLQF